MRFLVVIYCILWYSTVYMAIAKYYQICIFAEIQAPKDSYTFYIIISNVLRDESCALDIF